MVGAVGVVFPEVFPVEEVEVGVLVLRKINVLIRSSGFMIEIYFYLNSLRDPDSGHIPLTVKNTGWFLNARFLNASGIT